MSTKHVRTAADLVRFKCRLKVECGRCFNALTVDGYDIVRATGNADLGKLQKRIKCSLCGAREAKLTVLDPPPSRS